MCTKFMFVMTAPRPSSCDRNTRQTIMTANTHCMMAKKVKQRR